MASLQSRLKSLHPTIEELMRMAGTPGLSLAVMSKGETIHYASFGHRDSERGLPVTNDTIFPVCSLTKAVTAAAVGILVERGELEWDTLVKDVVPSFQSRDEILQENLTITDILSHRSGMAWASGLVIGSESNITIPREDGLKFINSRARLLPFRAGFSYNNLAYDLAGIVIEAVTQEPWEVFVKREILDRLGMDRTFFQAPPLEVNDVAQCYNALEDATPVPIPTITAGGDRFAGPSGGMRSCTSDLLKLYKAFSTCFNDQFDTGYTSTHDQPLYQLNHLMSAKIPMGQPSRNEISYACGWARVQLPNRMGQLGINPNLMANGMPSVGKGVPSQLVLFHQGSFPGALSNAMILPDTDQVIVVISNSLALNDVADWVGQFVLEEVLDVPASSRNDYIGASRTSIGESCSWYPQMTTWINYIQQRGTSPRELHEYVGTYWDDIHVIKFEIFLKDGRLYRALQGLETETFPLTHYEKDSFSWLQPRDDLSRRGRWLGPDQGPPFWKIDFVALDDGRIGKLLWVHDTGVPAAEFVKEV